MLGGYTFRLLVVEHARDVLIPNSVDRRRSQAHRHGVDAARCEPAAGRRTAQIWNGTFDLLQWSPSFPPTGQRREQTPRVWMSRCVKNIPHRPLLDDLTGVHD